MTLTTFKLTALALMLAAVTGCKPAADDGKPQATEGSIPVASTPETKPADQPNVTVEKMSLQQPHNQQMLVRLLNGVYGSANYDAKNQCWRQSLPDEDGEPQGSYCMGVARLDKVVVGDEVRWYIQTSGNAKDAGHPTPGAAGFLIFNAADDDIIASDPMSAYPLGYGNGPGEMQLWQLSPTGYFGWFGEGGYTAQGITSTTPVLMAPKGKQIADISGNLPGTTEDDQQFEYSYRVDQTAEVNDLHPIIVTEKDTGTGKKRTFTARFDRKNWGYRCEDKLCVDVRS